MFTAANQAITAADAINKATVGGALPAAGGGLLSGIMAGFSALTGPVGLAAGLLGGVGGSGMLGGSMKSSSATSSGTYYAGAFTVGDNTKQNWLLIGVIVLLIIFLWKGK